MHFSELIHLEIYVKFSRCWIRLASPKIVPELTFFFFTSNIFFALYGAGGTMPLDRTGSIEADLKTLLNLIIEKQ